MLFSKGGATLLAYPLQKTATSYETPSTVTSIGTGAFAYCGKLTTVIIPNSVSTIGEQAFQACDAITSIVIPTNVTKENKKRKYVKPAMRVVNLNPVLPLAQSLPLPGGPSPWQW